MVRVVANTVVKEDCLEKYLKLTEELIEATNAKDKGCIHYDLYKDTQNPLRFAFFEEWESMDALNEHMKAEHFERILPQIGDCCSKEAEISVYEKA